GPRPAPVVEVDALAEGGGQGCGRRDGAAFLEAADGVVPPAQERRDAGVPRHLRGGVRALHVPCEEVHRPVPFSMGGGGTAWWGRPRPCCGSAASSSRGGVRTGSAGGRPHRPSRTPAAAGAGSCRSARGR